jgi:hypothetical protein
MNEASVNRSVSLEAGAWRQRYEALRQLALGSRLLGADPLGLVLLLRQGVAGWMRSWAGSPLTPLAAPGLAPALPAAPQWQRQLTELLAEMSLAHLPNPPSL